MNYNDHDLITLVDVENESYLLLIVVRGGPIVCIPYDWVNGLDKVGLLGLIKMPHFGGLNEEIPTSRRFWPAFMVSHCG